MFHRSLVALALLLLISVFTFAVQPAAHAAAFQQIPATRRVDWAHPVKDYLPGPGRPHSGIVALNNTAQPNSAIAPNANFPSNCLNNYAYYVKVNGQTSWSAQVGNQKATVWYMWCPRWQGDAIGINWSFGKIYQLSGCAHISVGGLLGQEVGGALMLVQTSWPNWVDDGEPVTTYYTCSGHLVWDDSLTLPGNGLYKVLMFDNQVAAYSPCYC